jgi:hypothetical protein
MKIKEMARLRNKMAADSQFLAKLHNDKIISPHDPEYSKWKELRKNYEQKQLRIVSMKYGFRPAHPRIHTFFTYMFLHGGFGHLFGNMIFLWLVGCMLEMGCGRKFYSAIYVMDSDPKHMFGKPAAESWPTIHDVLKASHRAARLAACGP